MVFRFSEVNLSVEKWVFPKKEREKPKTKTYFPFLFSYKPSRSKSTEFKKDLNGFPLNLFIFFS